MPKSHAGGEIQPGDEILDLAKPSHAVRVFENGDLVRPLGTARRRVGQFVISSSQILIDLDRVKPGRIRILEILNNPHTAAVVEAHGRGLANVRLASCEFNLKAI